MCLECNGLSAPSSDQKFKVKGHIAAVHKQHRFQIFKKLGVKFNDLFLLTEWLQRNFNYFTVNLPLDFSDYNIFRITVFFFFFKNSRKFSKKT